MGYVGISLAEISGNLTKNLTEKGLTQKVSIRERSVQMNAELSISYSGEYLDVTLEIQLACVLGVR